MKRFCVTNLIKKLQKVRNKKEPNFLFNFYKIKVFLLVFIELQQQQQELINKMNVPFINMQKLNYFVFILNFKPQTYSIKFPLFI